ncbi:MAG: protein translocase subunit SecD, partial [Parachlamydiaceae bacterium]
MEKQKRWQFYLIIAVLALTLYNILPTIFYYSHPLRSPVDQPRAEQVAKEIVYRVNDLEEDSKDWLASFAKLLKVKPSSIETYHGQTGLIEVTFAKEEEANRFRRFLPKAGALIPFVPSQLKLYPQNKDKPLSVIVQREIDVKLNPNESQKSFQYFTKKDGEKISDSYKEMVKDRSITLLTAFGGTSLNGSLVEAAIVTGTGKGANELFIQIAQDMVDFEKSFSKQPEMVKRYLKSYTQFPGAGSQNLSQLLAQKLGAVKTELSAEMDKIRAEQKKQKADNAQFDPVQEQRLATLETQSAALEKAVALTKTYSSTFSQAEQPLSLKEAEALFDASFAKMNPKELEQSISLKGKSPFVESIQISWNNDRAFIQLYDDVEKLREQEVTSETSSFLQNKINHFIINDLAQASRTADEVLTPYENGFSVPLVSLPNAETFLRFDLRSLASKQLDEVNELLSASLSRKSRDLAPDAYPVRSYEAYSKEKAEDKKFGLVLYAPSMDAKEAPEGFNNSSIYVIARGLQPILQKAQAAGSSPEAKLLLEDLNELQRVMEGLNFIAYPGSSWGIAKEFSNDIIFAKNDYYSTYLKASRENFDVKGSKKFAILPFTDVEQRILALNEIEDKTQEDLLRSYEAYRLAQVDFDPASKYYVPAPTKNPYWSNFKISFAKYFRGDDRKILKWGLDLSGGKSVRIGLRDHNNQPVTNPQDIKQAVNELYTRINAMGVSERTIRVENNNIILEFPGSQALSAQDLVKSSAMYFHIVNEKFSDANPALKSPVNQFLQSVWSEASVTNRKDIDSIKEIAWRQLGGESLAQGKPLPTSEAARVLYENGLRLAAPKNSKTSNTFNDSLSTIAMLRGNDFSEWDGQTNPLLIVFNNFALEGASLTDIRVGYDQTEGNNLSFAIKRSYDSSDRAGSPRDDFYAWTSQFAEDKIAGTAREAYSHGRGWRMAVILNGQVISKPSLRAALRDNATITGRFSQREVEQLAADLKAGSLSFTPKILSEQNVSAELGSEEKIKGIGASLIALVLVVVAMCSYYRFAGLVATCAVLLNILIMWGVLQNLDAALTLPAIAGIVLTIGMAVDANVLVFERVREEFAISGRIASAIQAGYRKAFSAIIDSNITTVIAALILIQFDSGPIKGFAVTLIVGIVSSMFTSLFMTRYYFAGWVQDPNHKALKMMQFFGRTNFDFLKWSKAAIIASVILAIGGSYMLVDQRKTIFGMDFTGGYALNVEVEANPAIPSYRLTAYDAFLDQGASPRDVQIRELTKPNQLKIQLGVGFEEKNQPFYLMPQQLPEGKYAFEYQKNPRLDWVVKALEAKGMKISDTQLEGLDNNWSVMSGQLSDAMRNNAIIALGLAMISILIYITIRFEFKYAFAAVVGLAHDVVITLGILALFHALGFLVQIDLQVIGAIMTIIGYSLNDTIIVFDRIREVTRLMRKYSYSEIINHALNVTLSRTVMTSGTTLLVLFALVLLGGQTIFAFSLVMTI